MSVRIVTGGASERRGVDMLRAAQHNIVEAAGILGLSPADGGLWRALELIATERREAEQLLARRPRRVLG
jgi:hypothetical protein